MKRLMMVFVGALILSAAISTSAYAQRIGGAVIIKDPDFGTYVGQYKYPYSVTYTDYKGNTVTGTAWEYVDVSAYTLSECQNALNSAVFWGATITEYCHLQ